MSVQTTYSIYTGARVHGSLSDLRDNEVESYLAEGAVAFGVAVSRGTADNQVEVGGDGTGIGVAIRDLGREGVLRTGALTGYADTEAVSVLRRGAINLTIPSGGSAGDPLLYDDTTGVIDAGSASTGETQIVGAELLETVSAGAVGACRLSGQIA